MANHATPAPDAQPSVLTAVAEVLAEQFYLTVMNVTEDHWPTWEHVSHDIKSGYYDIGYEVAESVLAAITGGLR